MTLYRRALPLALVALCSLPWMGCANRPAENVVAGSLEQEQGALKDRMRARWGSAEELEKQRWIDLLDLVEALGREVRDPDRSVDPDVWPELATELVELEAEIVKGVTATKIRARHARIAELRAAMTGG